MTTDKSNLLLERLVARQLMEHLSLADLLPPLQSGFRQGHSTETAVLRVLSDILQAVDRGDVAALVLLDLSAAFDTVDHSILLERLQQTFGNSDTALCWFQSYLLSKTQYVRRGPNKSSVTYLICGVPQGSVLGPILFVLYTVDLLRVIDNYGLSPHMYADDTRCMDSVGRPQQQRSQRTSLIALKQPHPGCDQTGFNPIQTRQSSCAVRPSGDNINCQRHR